MDDVRVTLYAPSIINSVVRVGGPPVPVASRTKHGKFLPLSISNGTSVGPAGTMVGRDTALFPGVATTGITRGTSTTHLAEPTDWISKTDDFAGVSLAYGARGPMGITSIGSPLISEGSPHGVGRSPSGV